MTTIQNIDFADNEIIVSVGFFLAADLPKLFADAPPRYVEAYEPRGTVHEDYVLAGRSWETFVPVRRAITSYNGRTWLHVAGTRSTTRHIESKRGYEVATVAMRDVLRRVSDRYGMIDKLLVNCEGAEIDIIDNTEPEAFACCRFIFVQFHPFLTHLAITQQDVDRCVKKLSSLFETTLRRGKYFKYDFRRRTT